MSAKRRLVMVARDIAPSSAFDRLQKELANDARVETICFLGFGKPLNADISKIEEVVRESDFVFLGMSSSVDLSKEERAAGKAAVSTGKFLGFYDDIEGGYNRPWFQEDPDCPGSPGLVHSADVLFVVDEKQAVLARKLFPRARVIASGNPILEEAFFPKMSREEVRKRLGVEENEIMILCAGDKRPAISFPLFSTVIDAAVAVHTLCLREPNHRYKIFLALHPGDMAVKYVYDKDNNLKEGNYGDEEINSSSVYRELVKFGTVSGKVEVRVITGKTMRTDDMLPGIDLLVQAGSTTGKAAARLRKPVIDVMSTVSDNWYKSSIGGGAWETVKQGVSGGVSCDSSELGIAMEKLLLAPGGFEEMRKRQEEVYPKPAERGVALRIMAETIKELL